MVLGIRAIDTECHHDGGQGASSLFLGTEESMINQ